MLSELQDMILQCLTRNKKIAIIKESYAVESK